MVVVVVVCVWGRGGWGVMARGRDAHTHFWNNKVTHTTKNKPNTQLPPPPQPTIHTRDPPKNQNATGAGHAEDRVLADGDVEGPAAVEEPLPIVQVLHLVNHGEALLPVSGVFFGGWLVVGCW